MLTVRQLSKSFNGRKAVDSVSMEAAPGDHIVILGHSGSGKTTLLRLIAGLEIPDSGEVNIEGQLASNSKYVLPPHQRNLGFVFQSPALWPHMTIAQNILFGLENLSREEQKSRLTEISEILFIKEFINRYPHEISGGEARRASIARTLAPCPRYLLMDEPLTNLDDALRKRVMSAVLEIVINNRSALIYVTHHQDEASFISNRVLKMNQGMLEA
jgi:iron(III) transport system ATP-binding protein